MKKVLTTVLILFFLFSAQPSHAQNPGDLDPGFGSGGKLTTALGFGLDVANAMAIQPDGKIVAVGSSQSGLSDYVFTLARFNTNGSLDETFGSGGVVLTDFGSGNSYAYSVAIDDEGKIVVAGYASNGSNNDFALARYNSNGSLDTDFDTDGKVLTDFGFGNDDARSVFIDSNGKIVVAGYASNGSDYDFALVRYNSDGSLDVSFDTDGKVLTDFEGGGDQGQSVVLDSDGKIVVAGYASNGSDYDFALARYNSNGSLDVSFDTDGKVLTDFDLEYDRAYAVAIDTDGKIVVAGQASNGSNTDFALLRYNSDGTLDGSFGTGGIVRTDFASGNDDARSVFIDSNGKIVVAGYASNGSDYDFALARYNSDGSLDTDFDTDGKVLTDFEGIDDMGVYVLIDASGNFVVSGFASNQSGIDFALARYNSNGSLDLSFDSDGKVSSNLSSFSNYYETANSVAFQSDGKIVVAGVSGMSQLYFGVVRYNTDGSLDTEFGTGGKVLTDIGIGNKSAESVAIQSDGKIVVAGYASNGSNYDFALVRYISDGTLDGSFGTDGKVLTDFGNGNSQAQSVAIQSDGKIVVAGYHSTLGNADFAIVRYNGDGSLDTDFGTDGIALADFGVNDDYGYSLAIQTDGKYVVVGRADNNDSNEEFGVARFNSDGSLDTEFGTGGIVSTNFGVGDDVAYSVAMQADSKIVVTGKAHDGVNVQVALARYNSDGSLDGSFGPGGTIIMAYGNTNAAQSVVIQSDGKIVVAGTILNGLVYNFLLLRFNSAGSLDGSFGTGGIVTTDFGVGDAQAIDVAIQDDGKIVAVGLTGSSLNYDFALARYYSGIEAPLPVELSNFTGVSTKLGVNLNWVTQTESDNAGFVILRNGLEIAGYENTEALKGQGSTTQTHSYTFIDSDVSLDETYTYVLMSVDYSGARHTYSKTVEVKVTQALENEKVYEYALDQNYPNPFNPSTTINFTMKQAGLATLKVFDMLGRKVFENQLNAKAGSNTFLFNGENFSSGVYFYQLNIQGFSQTKKMMLMK